MEKRKLLTMEHPDQNNDRLKLMKVYLVAFYDDIRKLKDSDKCTVRIRITHKSRPYYYSTPIQVIPEEYKKIAAPKPRGVYKDKRDIIWEMLKKANDIIIEMGDFDASSFKSKLRGEKSDWSDIWAVFDYQIKTLEKRGRYNYAVTYTTAKKSFEKFSKEKSKKADTFDDITKKWLEAYEDWANEEIIVNGKKKKRLSQSSVGINTRNLKVLFNLARENGGTKKNPFLEYSPPAPRNIKKALSKADVKKIFDYKPEPGFEGLYRDLWIFSYLCNGMNISDILRLKYKNIDDDSIIFIRQKTSGKRNLKPVQADYSDKAKKIVDRWGQKPVLDDSYIFPILSISMDEERRVTKIKHATKACNTHMKAIAEKIGIDPNISTYYARHSFATVLKLSGTDLAYISESLGHSNLQTTENYLSSFDSKARKKATKALVDFD